MNSPSALTFASLQTTNAAKATNTTAALILLHSNTLSLFLFSFFPFFLFFLVQEAGDCWGGVLAEQRSSIKNL
jgi:hypothetical protein